MYNEHHGTIRSQNRIVPRTRPIGGSFENYKEEKYRLHDDGKGPEQSYQRPTYLEENKRKYQQKNDYSYTFQPQNREKQGKFSNSFMERPAETNRQMHTQKYDQFEGKRNPHKRTQSYSNQTDLNLYHRKHSVQLPGKQDPIDRRTTQDYEYQRDYNKQDYKFQPNMKKTNKYEQYPEQRQRNYRRGYEEELKPYDKRQQTYDFEEKKSNFYRRQPERQPYEGKKYSDLGYQKKNDQYDGHYGRNRRENYSKSYQQSPNRKESKYDMWKPEKNMSTNNLRKFQFRQMEDRSTENWKSQNRTIDKPMDRQMERQIERQMERPMDRPMERPMDRQFQRQYQRPIERPIERPIDRQIENRRTMGHQPKNISPTLSPHLGTPSSKKHVELEESSEKRRSLIEKSKNLKEKLIKITENTPEKFYQSNSHQGQGNPKERIEYLKQSKDRFYESPFKQQAQYRDFEDKNENCEKQEDPYMKKISLFGNNIENQYQSQRLNTKSNYSHNEGKTTTNKENGYDCMGRINMLNSKINERINSIINSFSGKEV